MMTCPATPETPKRRHSYLPPPQMLSGAFESPTPMTPTHRLRPVESSPCSSIKSISVLLEQDPCMTPNTPRRRLAALILDTPTSTADPLCVTPKRRSLTKLRSDHSSTSHKENNSPKRRLPQLTPLDDPPASPYTSPSKRRAKLSISHPLSGRRKQKESVKEYMLPPLLNDSSKLFEVSWSTFPDMSSASLDYFHKPEPTQVSVAKAQAFIDKAQKFVEDQNRYKTELDVCVKRFQRVAQARLKSGSETGAVLAAKKVKKMENEQGRVTKAVGLVSDALSEMKREIRRAKTESDRSNRNKVSLGENLSVLEEAEAILSKRPSVKWEKEQLLAEVQKWTVPTSAV